MIKDELQTALDELARGRDVLERARRAHQEARDRVHEELDLIAASRSEEQGIDGDLARLLYWEHPEVHVKRIGLACGIYDHTKVYRYSGKTFAVVVRCRDCGDTLETVTVGSRAAFKTSTHRWRYCNACDEARWDEWERARGPQ